MEENNKSSKKSWLIGLAIAPMLALTLNGQNTSANDGTSDSSSSSLSSDYGDDSSTPNETKKEDEKESLKSEDEQVNEIIESASENSSSSSSSKDDYQTADLFNETSIPDQLPDLPDEPENNQGSDNNSENNNAGGTGETEIPGDTGNNGGNTGGEGETEIPGDGSNNGGNNGGNGNDGGGSVVIGEAQQKYNDAVDSFIKEAGKSQKWLNEHNLGAQTQLNSIKSRINNLNTQKTLLKSLNPSSAAYDQAYANYENGIKGLHSQIESYNKRLDRDAKTMKEEATNFLKSNGQSIKDANQKVTDAYDPALSEANANGTVDSFRQKEGDYKNTFDKVTEQTNKINDISSNGYDFSKEKKEVSSLTLPDLSGLQTPNGQTFFSSGYIEETSYLEDLVGFDNSNFSDNQNSEVNIVSDDNNQEQYFENPFQTVSEFTSDETNTETNDVEVIGEGLVVEVPTIDNNSNDSNDSQSINDNASDSEFSVISVDGEEMGAIDVSF